MNILELNSSYSIFDLKLAMISVARILLTHVFFEMVTHGPLAYQ